MREFGHPNICRLFEIFESQTHLLSVMELCLGGTLLDRILTQGDVANTPTASPPHTSHSERQQRGAPRPDHSALCSCQPLCHVLALRAVCLYRVAPLRRVCA